MSSQNSPEAILYLSYCDTIKKNFEARQQKGRFGGFDIASLWFRKYRNKLDIGAFLIPIIKECHSLFYDNSIEDNDRQEIAIDLKDYIYSRIEEIQEKERVDLSFLLAWLKFHIVRLQKITLISHVLALNEWLRKCYDVDNLKTTHYFNLFQLNRDQEMRAIVFDEQGQVREFFYSEIAPGRLYRTKLITWFLRRYDLTAAFVLARAASGHVKPDRRIKAGLGQGLLPAGFWLVFILWASVYSFLIICAGGYLFEYKALCAKSVQNLAIFQYLPGNNPPSSELPIEELWSIPIYQLGILLTVNILLGIGIYWSLRGVIFDRIQLLLPRLNAGILVGYVPLVTASDPWQWLLRMQKAPAIISCFLMSILSFGYLFIEARKTLAAGELESYMRRELWHRVVHIFLIGFLQTLLIGVVASEIFGITVITALSLSGNAQEITIIAVKGVLGYLFPKMVLLYAPFALFLGILIQLVWEEKTVTQPL